MDDVTQHSPARRKDDRTIIHFDMDCFYASVFEVSNPALKTLPLAVQQKHIIVTCNYEARRRGLHKLQLISEARRICPDVVIELGEDLTRFRDASKALFAYLQSFSWNGRLEKLGFDEIFMDVSDMVDYNIDLLNPNDLQHSFFCLDRLDPMSGFVFDARAACGPVYPEAKPHVPCAQPPGSPSSPPHARHGRHGDSEEGKKLRSRLVLGSWLAQHLRHCLEEHTGYTATVGISTNKLLSKLVGNLNKPHSQTVLLPPYVSSNSGASHSNITTFLASHDIAKIPGIGFKTAQKIRHHILPQSTDVPPSNPLYHAPPEQLTVSTLLSHPLSPSLLSRILSGPGMPRDIGTTVWNLLHGIDDSEVKIARRVPSQISIEDSYLSLTTPAQLHRKLHALAGKLVARMRLDLLDDSAQKRWIATPKTVRLTTRSRAAAGEPRSRALKRVSRSAPLPGSLRGREWVVEDRDVPPDGVDGDMDLDLENGGDDEVNDREEWRVDEGDADDNDDDDGTRVEKLTTEPSAGRDVSPHLEEAWDNDEDEEIDGLRCAICGTWILPFAMRAHERFHAAEET